MCEAPWPDEKCVPKPLAMEQEVTDIRKEQHKSDVYYDDWTITLALSAARDTPVFTRGFEDPVWLMWCNVPSS